MSAGSFVKSKYATKIVNPAGGTHIVPIRIQPETAACTINGVGNGAPAGALSLPISAVVSRGRRARGIIPRTVTLENTNTTGTGGYKNGGYITLPALTQDFYDAAAAATSTTPITYLDRGTWRVSYVSDELVK